MDLPKPYYDDEVVQIYCGDCRDMSAVPDASVQCVITSPPYWGLRDYGTATWEGGDPSCGHDPADTPQRRGLLRSTLQGGKQTTGHQREGYKAVCARCGAVRVDNQLGLELTPEEYIGEIVAIFREVRRVLRDDGTLWLNMGDCYASAPAGRMTTSGTLEGGGFRENKPFDTAKASGLKPKDLVGVPWHLAFALQADGWWLRSDIIWHKPNPMPESVTDRPTKAHEYLFLLAKSETYYYDAEAIREPHQDRAGIDRFTGHGGKSLPEYEERKWTDRSDGLARPPMTMRDREYNPNGRNRRSVWTIVTQPYPEAHFATFPEALVEPCVLAGSRRGDTVLDPFSGSGTALWVAKRLGRKAIGYELKQEYCDLAVKRMAQMVMPL